MISLMVQQRRVCVLASVDEHRHASAGLPVTPVPFARGCEVEFWKRWESKSRGVLRDMRDDGESGRWIASVRSILVSVMDSLGVKSSPSIAPANCQECPPIHPRWR
jgi:hypothetical protein